MELPEKEKKSTVLKSLIDELERGVAIIRDIDDETFTMTEHGNGSVGAHIRHNLDFVNALLEGLTEKNIDYNLRSRDRCVETNRWYAEEQTLSAIARLERLNPCTLQRIVMVRSEVDPDDWFPSSVSREIEFLHSHTVHHYALIARLIAEAGQFVSEDLGVAPSTLRYRAESGQRPAYSGNY
jgi:hypothetical protein